MGIAPSSTAGDLVPRLLRRLIDDRAGVTAIEYAVLTTLLALAIIVSATVAGTNLNQTFDTVAVALGGSPHDHDGH